MAIATNLDRTYGTPAPADEVEIRPKAARQISWGAVFAGVAMVLAVQILLSMLGLGIGFSTVDPAQNGGTPSASSLSIGAGLWWGASYFLALVIGGHVAARLAR
jgi:hypothetical protein